MTSEVVDSLAFREKVSAALAAVASQQLAADHPLEASIAAQRCLSVDRYRCSCIRDAGLGRAGMESADATTLAAVRLHAWDYLMEYVSCDETAADAPKMLALASKWSGASRYPYALAALPAGALEVTAPGDLLAEGNWLFQQLVPLPAKRRFEVCSSREPVLCECPKRAGDAWFKLHDRERAIVWWSRYLDCAPAAADRALVEKDLAAARSSLKSEPIWRGAATVPDSTVVAAPDLAKTLMADARRAVKEKRLDDAVTAYTVCRLVDPRAWDCALELAGTLMKLDRRGEANQVYQLLANDLPRGDKRRALVKQRVER